jgi:hypothetical protein
MGYADDIDLKNQKKRETQSHRGEAIQHLEEVIKLYTVVINQIS